jgi:alkylated DNA repair dioxygenase AlkB
MGLHFTRRTRTPRHGRPFVRCAGAAGFAGRTYNRRVDQTLFGPEPSSLPAGFEYRPEFVTLSEERDLVRQLEPMPFESFQFHGFLGKRRVVSFGWRYDFNDSELRKVDDMPPFLLRLRERAAALAGLPPSGFQHVLVTEYAPGAGIGWHRDKAVFDEVVGISLLSPCDFRFRRKAGDKWERATIVTAPRSAYLLKGPARTEWEHSIPAVNSLRYSITFRNLSG